MCGIVGYLNLNRQPLATDKALLEKMCKTIHHRGPDDQGQLVIGPCGMGMTRLSIIDLKTGHQPIGNEDGSVWIVFNGEIYNFHHLQEKLIAHGHTLATKSDTETIVHLYEEYGVECLQFLEGMFAFALWDNERQRLFMARDRMGEKPLHWGIFDGQLVFGSEIKSLLEHPKVKRELNPAALQRFLSFEYVPAPDSIFAGINKLMPAQYMVVENGDIKTKTYWQPPEYPEPVKEAEAGERLVELLTDSIKGRLISDVPLGVFLSGGIDSSSIAALAQKISDSPVKTFSIGFSDKSFDESDHARLVAGHLGTDHHVATFTPELAIETLHELWDYLDEPFADASIVPTFFLSKMTREKVTVALSGEGGDELFGGYPTYQAHKLASMWRKMPRPLRKGLIEPAIKGLPVSLNNLSFDYKAKRFISAAGDPPLKRHLKWMGSFPYADQVNLIEPELMTLMKEEDIYPGLASETSAPSNGGWDVISRILHLDMTTYLPDDLLVKSDRASMAASLEVRLPFLAYPLVEFAVELPSRYKLNGLTTKYLLKKAMAPYLPEEIIKRPKKGFGIPVGKWLKKELKSQVDELLGEEFIRKQSIFMWPYVKQLLDEHYRARADRRKELWTLLMFQWWWRKFFT